MSGKIVLFSLIIYSAILLLISYLSGKDNSNTSFFLANRRSPWFVVSFGMIGASISGVTYVSVSGWVASTGFTYMQMVFGFVLGYIVVANVLLPLYYKLGLVSIYTYLKDRFGMASYKTGASFFLISKLVSVIIRGYLAIYILQRFVLSVWNIPFSVTLILSMLLIFLYTFRAGIKTIVWTDFFQTACIIITIVLIFVQVRTSLQVTSGETLRMIADSPFSKMFVFDDWSSSRNFFKMFMSGVFVVIVMTGLDQDMMQKNLSCKNIKEAKKNMYWNSIAYIPVNLLLLSLGVLLLIYIQEKGIPFPANSDDLLPMLTTQHYFGTTCVVLFTIGVIASTFSSMDSAITSITTSFSIDILDISKYEKRKSQRIRMIIHFCVVVVVTYGIFVTQEFISTNVIDAVYTMVSYTYGPLLGLFAFGLFTNRNVRDRFVPVIAVISPVVTWVIQYVCLRFFAYEFGYEALILNGMFTFIGLLLVVKKEQKPSAQPKYGNKKSYIYNERRLRR